MLLTVLSATLIDFANEINHTILLGITLITRPSKRIQPQPMPFIK
jgi:hypothetical protein